LVAEGSTGIQALTCCKMATAVPIVLLLLGLLFYSAQGGSDTVWVRICCS
jgi:hypothetical protein